MQQKDVFLTGFQISVKRIVYLQGREKVSADLIKVLIITGAMDVGGIENQLMHLLRNADREKFQIDFTTTMEHRFIVMRSKRSAAGASAPTDGRVGTFSGSARRFTVR